MLCFVSKDGESRCKGKGGEGTAVSLPYICLFISGISNVWPLLFGNSRLIKD